MEILLGILIITIIVWKFMSKGNKADFYDDAVIRPKITISEDKEHKYAENNLVENDSKQTNWNDFDYLRHEQRIEARVRKALARERDALSILTFVCKADGRMMPAERAVIISYLKRRCRDILNKDDNITEVIKALVAPEYRDYKKAVTTIKSSSDIDRLRDIYDCAKRIVATQKKVDPLEKASLEILEIAINDKSSTKESATA